MNISQPIVSSLEAVEFSFLEPDEIRAISARRIENEQTFDSLNNPVPGGLYDPALGSWGDSLCTTCNLSQTLCPGHPGHIDLPIPVYHAVFMDQIYRLLKAQCIYCHRFRLPRQEVHRYTCMLRLLQHGLLREAQMIDAIGHTEFDQHMHDLLLSGVPAVTTDEAEEEGDDVRAGVIRAREAYVNETLRKNRPNLRPSEIKKGKHEGAAAMRRDLVKEFLAAMVAGKKCFGCGGISPAYRKDRCVKIFERELGAKDKQAMIMLGKHRANPLVAARKPRKGQSQGQGYISDEGIADVDMSDGGSSDNSSESEGQGEDLDEDGNVVAASERRKKTEKKEKKPDVEGRAQRYLPVPEVMARLELLFDKEQDILSLLYNSKPQSRQTKRPSASMFFLQTLLVPPNRYRPEARQGDTVTQAQQNNLYQLILRSAGEVAQISREISRSASGAGAEAGGRRARDIAAFHEACTVLQDCVNSLIDKSKNPVQGMAAKRNEDGIKQKLEKKEGLFRMNMMGKRVNFAARSVISPDPNIETNEIGVPPVFASKLTYPEPVTSHNFKDMQQAVINGVEKWPGASAIEMESGQIINLRNKSLEDRVALANQLLTPGSNNPGGLRNKKVHRHLSNGDVVLMNRQPTLHKPSIMGHRVRVLPGEKTIRMHYANCNTYNADFDGDEMNMHFPQNELARAEALQVADTDHQYISGTAGKPLRGLIQDHLSVSVALGNKDTFFDRDAYQQLVYGALRPESGHIMGERIELVAPAVIKPVARWTGKQVVTTILKNIRPPNCGDLWMNGTSQIKGDRWGGHSEEGQVLFRDGYFVCGILDKAQLGPSSGGFVHAVYEVYGPAVAGKLLSGMGRLLTRYLNMRAFTCGMDDLRMTRAGEADRKKQLEAAGRAGLEVAAQYVSLSEHQPTKDDPELLRRLEEVMRDDKKQEGLDLLMNQTCARLSTGVTSACLPAGLEKQFPKNQMQSMTTSGAKGGSVNANLISCNLGQQVLEGRRVPVMVSGKTLPCFKPFDTDVRAGGYVVNRFLTGIRPQEYFFHLMAGREGLIDTAVKTSRSGYLQRCIIKGMEGLEVAYDTTVRDADGTVCQFLYGEDGLDVTKQKYLADFGFVLHNRDSQLAQTRYSEEVSQALFHQRDLIVKQMKDTIKSVKTRGPDRALDPVISVLDPARFAFATSESFFEAMMGYVKTNADGLIKEKGGEKGTKSSSAAGGGGSQISRKTAEKLLSLKYLRSLVEPGEAVGIVAGQSIGEPSTQMTLNTFHLAGHSAKNVTLGIPRLREILMTASRQIATPTMTLVLNEELSPADGEQFAKAISALSLAHVLDAATVRESMGRGTMYPLAKTYNIRLRFFPSAEYAKAYAISVHDVLLAVERKFVPTLEALIKKAIRKAQASSSAATPDVGVRDRAEPAPVGGGGGGGGGGGENGNNNTTIVAGDDDDEGPGGGGGGGDDDDDSDDDDDDATNAKAKANKTEAVSYGPNDDDDDVIQKRMERDALSDAGDDIEDDNNNNNNNNSNVDEGYEGSPEPEENGDVNEEDEKEAHAREDRIKENNRHVTRFRCDRVGGEWCEMTLEFDAAVPKFLMIVIVQEAVRRSTIQQIRGVGGCTFVAEEKMKDARTGEEAAVPVVHTEGANLKAMQQYGDYINPNRIATNDIAAVLDVYGVEACRATVVRELRAVFAGHGISVDTRHLTLIADCMTRNGGYTPFNRMGLVGNISPFTKMSFETTFAFLKDAVLDGDWDVLSTPSSRLVVGKLSKVGTGSFDILTQVPTQHLDPVHARDDE